MKDSIISDYSVSNVDSPLELKKTGPSVSEVESTSNKDYGTLIIALTVLVENCCCPFTWDL